MKFKLEKIEKIVSEIQGVSIDEGFSLDSNFNIIGKVTIDIENSDENVAFVVKILPEYPLKTQNSEAILFSNIELLEYGHVMGNGSICIHTSHHIDLKRKLEIDFNSLKRWIWKYYLNNENDLHYEHIIMQPKDFKDIHYSYLFTEVDFAFRKKQFGFFEYSKLNDGQYFEKTVLNHVVQSFTDENSKLIADCKWSNGVKNLTKSTKNSGLYVYVENAPVQNKKFIINNWKDLEKFVGQDFFRFLYNVQKANYKNKGNVIPLFVGYKISETEVHWQSAILEFGSFPIDSEKIDQKWYGIFIDEKIIWGITRNCSYEYFFGRGRFVDKITKSKILIIGVGAIGSIVATSLTRGGCLNIDIVDFDVKEPENVCRSEYAFINGLNNKVNELSNLLFSISPFIEVGILDENFFHIYTKMLNGIEKSKNELKSTLNNYDLIIDCSTDNDLMYVLNQLELINLITISVTNNARDLVCSTEPRSYEWVLNQFENVLENDIEDVYNPTGCWSPTFKASYNDINTLVQYAIKNINLKLSDESKVLRNFVLKTENQNGFNIKLNEF